MTDVIFAPWSPNEVSALNRWQATPTVHPFTCASDHDGDRDLIARVDGWHCPTCGYRQTWAHKVMLDMPPTTVLGGMHLSDPNAFKGPKG